MAGEAKHDISETNGNESDKSNEEQKDEKTQEEEQMLTRMAEEELLREARRGAARASVIGIKGWQQCPVPKPNRRFLSYMLMNNVRDRHGRHGHREKRARYDHRGDDYGKRGSRSDRPRHSRDKYKERKHSSST